MSPRQPLISLSVVSHGQSALVKNLFTDLINISPSDFEVIVTINVPEPSDVFESCPYPTIVIRNETPKGFGANHNAAFAHAKGKFFAVVNPDIRIESLDLGRLLGPFEAAGVGLVAPLVVSSHGTVEDSARRFPTLARLARRVLLRQKRPDYRPDNEPIRVDWVAGMFMVFRPEIFSALGGFDAKRFFMYMEDADICRRARLRGYEVIVQPVEKVIHDAQRASQRNFRHMKWHLISVIRYLSGL